MSEELSKEDGAIPIVAAHLIDDEAMLVAPVIEAVDIDAAEIEEPGSRLINSAPGDVGIAISGPVPVAVDIDGASATVEGTDALETAPEEST